MSIKRPTGSKDEIGSVEFPIRLGIAYYNHGFFNVRVDYGRYFEGDGANIDIYLEANPIPIHAKISRRVNKNGMPRIMAGTRYRDWVQSKFRMGEEFSVCLLRDGSIRLRPFGG